MDYYKRFGCPSSQGTQVYPCPPHVVCGWIRNLADRKTFCRPDPSFIAPKKQDYALQAKGGVTSALGALGQIGG